MFRKIFILSILLINLTAMDSLQRIKDREAMLNLYNNAPMLCAKHNRLDLLKKVVNGGANIDSTDHAGQTSLMIAAMHGYEDIVNFLVSKNASLNHKDMFGKTALDNARDFNHPKIAEFLAWALEMEQLWEQPISPEIVARVNYEYCKAEIVLCSLKTKRVELVSPNTKHPISILDYLDF
ncbi:ankyrin repeat domain-containing protein [Candidatus Dependentiae bacterium]|nr:ankyrin repeat domain-containing protein [Candidatus Dependentiae bacterium]